MKLELSQRFYFDAAHTLNRDIETAGSARIHGHTYHSEIAVTGAVDRETGMVLDLGHLRVLTEKIRELLDHQMLDDVADLGCPTLENLCAFIARLADSSGISLSRVSIWRKGVGDRCDLRLV